MVGRRSVLGAGALAGASALAGCSVLGGGNEGDPARFGRGATAPADPDVVALADSVEGGHPAGRLESSTAVFERADGRLVVVSYYRVRAGETEFGSGYRYRSVDATHDWTGRDGEVVRAETNMTTIPAESADVRFRLAASTGDRTRTWRVDLPEASTQAVAYRFRSEFQPAAAPEDGDALVTVAGESTLTDGSLVGGTRSVETEHALVYGDTTPGSER